MKSVAEFWSERTETVLVSGPASHPATRRKTDAAFFMCDQTRQKFLLPGDT